MESGGLSGDIGRFWYGFPGFVQRVAIGVAVGMSSAAAFWVVAIRNAGGQQRVRRFLG